MASQVRRTALEAVAKDKTRSLFLSPDDFIFAKEDGGVVMPMFLGLNTALGICLLFAAKHPAKHRLMIAYGAWSSLAHTFTMTIMSARAVARGMHRQGSPQDIVMFVVLGGTLLALLPAREAGAPVSEPRFAER